MTVCEQTIQTERRRLLPELVPTFAYKGCHVISVTSLRPYSRISRPHCVCVCVCVCVCIYIYTYICIYM
jgi:hypothetical protein